VVIATEWTPSLALQLTSTTSIVGWESATSSAVMAPPGLGDYNRQPCYCSRFGGRFDANGDGIRRAGRGHGVVFLYVTSVSGELATAVG
jgi:hypothetical protein